MKQVYVYQSCIPLNKTEEKNTQVAQTEMSILVDQVGTVFFDNDGYGWKYLGIFDEPYKPTEDVILIEYEGNFFEDVFESVVQSTC